jgi:hypothetical protein
VTDSLRFSMLGPVEAHVSAEAVVRGFDERR